MEKKDASYWIQALGMEKHPEGGYFCGLYRCPEMISDRETALGFTGNRSVASSIYFLLPTGEVSRFHRLKFDELWYFHAGNPVVIYVIDTAGVLRELRLGACCEKGERPQAVIPRGSIFGAVTEGNEGCSLVGCMVCPGFEYDDFELLRQEELLRDYPQHREIILKLT